MNGPSGPGTAVEGERDATALATPRGLQARMSNALALLLVSAVGLGALVWYYAHALTRDTHAREEARAAATRRVDADAPLPRLEAFGAAPPSIIPAPARDPLPPPDLPPAAQSLPEIPLGVAPVYQAGSPAPKSPAQIELERRLSGSVFAPGSGLAAPSSAMAAVQAVPGAVGAHGGTGGAGGEMAALLRPNVMPPAVAHTLPAQRLLLPKGAFIDCTLETAIDSTLPGMTTCVMATDAFGVNGEVVLMERGTKLVGETRGQVQQGAARLFVLWTEARTPAGVIVPLDSPGTDELGRSGLAGEVDRHFWQRFGAAMLVSVIDGAVQAAVQSTRGNGGAVIVNPSASQDVLTEILRSTVAIPPTVTKRNGDRIQVLVARDIDFRTVYELRSAARR